MNRGDAVRRLIEAAGRKSVSMYATAAEGPGVMVIFDVPDALSGPAIAGVVTATGAAQNIKLTRLISAEEVVEVRKKAAQIRGAYIPPAKA